MGDVVENVTWILDKFPACRNSYKRLMVRYWAEFDGLKSVLGGGEEGLERFLHWFTSRATSPKTIQNRAGEIQNAKPGLEACPNVADWRLRQSRVGLVT